MRFCYSLFFLFSLAFLDAQSIIYDIPHNKTDVANNDLKGNVKYVLTTEWEMVVKFGDPVKDHFTSKEEFFFKKNGYFDQRTFAYERGEAKRTRNYHYNKIDRLSEIKTIYSDRSIETKEFIYNAKNQITEINFYDKKNKLFWKDKYSYDDNGLKSITKYSGDGKYNDKKSFKWDSQSRMIAEYSHDKKEELSEFIYSEYDKNGNLIVQKEGLIFGGTDIPSDKTDFTYNSKNLLVKKATLYDTSKNLYQFFYTYDANGNVIKEEKKESNPVKISIIEQCSYTYDSNGNWLTKLIENEDKEYTLIEREIKYY